MIKINLYKEKKRGKLEAPSLKLPLKGIKLGELPTLGKMEHYASIPLWLGVLGMGVWYFKTSGQLTEVKREMDQLQAEKSRLSAKVQQMVEEKKRIEADISRLDGEINSLERSKDVLIGLKELYITFNDGFRKFSSLTPPAGWMASYSQTLDLDNKKLKTEFELNSFDYASIGSYTMGLSKAGSGVFINNIERKTTPSGYEYYSAKLTAEKNLGAR